MYCHCLSWEKQASKQAHWQIHCFSSRHPGQALATLILTLDAWPLCDCECTQKGYVWLQKTMAGAVSEVPKWDLPQTGFSFHLAFHPHLPHIPSTFSQHRGNHTIHCYICILSQCRKNGMCNVIPTWFMCKGVRWNISAHAAITSTGFLCPIPIHTAEKCKVNSTQDPGFSIVNFPPCRIPEREGKLIFSWVP